VGDIKYESHTREVGGDAQERRVAVFSKWRIPSHSLRGPNRFVEKVTKKIRKWEKQHAEDYTEFWPISHEFVSAWVSTLAKLPLTPDVELIKGDMKKKKRIDERINNNQKCLPY
jgi:hypothetical protein